MNIPFIKKTNSEENKMLEEAKEVEVDYKSLYYDAKTECNDLKNKMITANNSSIIWKEKYLLIKELFEKIIDKLADK